VSDFYYRYTSLHISGDSNPTWITDASTNALAVAPAGAPQATIFSPVKEGYYGNSFSGGEYLTIPDSASFTFGANDFTIECWVYSSFAANYGIMSNCDSGTSTSSMTFYFAAFGTQVMAMAAYGSTLIQAAAPALTPNAWNHVAFVRDGTVTRAYTNGVQGATTGAIGTNALNDSVNVMTIGRFGNYASMYFNGYISNLRIVKGTCVYPNGTTFTPSATPLTAITNTVLLTCQSNRFIDNSAAPATITVAGTPKVVSSNPFNLPSGLAAYGSGYFNGSSYLSIPSNATLAMGTGDFTIECWVNTPLVNANNDVLIELRSTGATSTGFVFNMNPTGVGYQLNFYTDGGFNLGSTVLNYNVWNHVAVTRSGTTVRLFSNGVVSATFTKANNFSDTPVPQIGSSPLYSPSSVIGYISNLRVVKGTAVYIAAFTPPTAPLTAISGTVLLMPFTNAAVYDNTMLNNFETVGDMQVNTSTFKYGTGALKFDGTGDYITVSGGASSLHSIQSGAFTVEMWIYRVGNSSGSGTYDALIGSNNVSSAVWGVYVNKNTLAVSFYSSVGLVETTATISNSVWTHIAVSRTTGNNLQIFINGVSGYSASNTGIGTLVNPLYIGADVNNNTFNGYIDELRITKGFARYTATFTPSTGAYSVSAPFGASTLPSKSLRFRSSASAYLNRTPTVAGNQKTWTWSGWVKRGTLGTTQYLFGAYTGVLDDQGLFSFSFSSANNIYISAATLDWRTTTAVYRDPAAWYHIVVAFDTTQSNAANRIKLYVNGAQVTAFGTTNNPVQNTEYAVNSSQVHRSGRSPYSSGYFDGEMAEVNFVDGLALDPTMFGAYSTYGQWLPISYAGYQGANGFYLPFNVGTDTSSVSVNYLAVAGGGGGGTGQSPSTVGQGGGGGAGGLLTGTTSLVINNVYPIVIGAGGNAGTPGVNSGSGANSTAFGITATGGGAGGNYDGNAGQTGGSGGGAGYGGAVGAGTSGQGYAGGAGITGAVPYPAGGGGGAGAVGTNGPGGVGVQSSITGSSTYYAGGGAGGNGSNVTASSGGSGGGGTGGYGTTAGTAGTANLGGGGGGGGNQGTGGTTSSNGAAGGSGVVIISYSGTQKFYGGTVTSSGGNTIHTFTSSSALTSIFADQSGNGNTWTANNINVSTPGPTYDLLTDVPTLTSATAANYAVLNPLEVYGMTLTDGNLKATAGTTAHYNARSTIYMPSSGKWYFEGQATSVSNPGQMSLGLVNSSIAVSTQAYAAGYYSIYFGFSGATTNLYINNNGTSSSANSISAAISDITQVAYDATTGKLWLGYNNSWKNSSGATDATANPGTGTNPTMTISTAISLSPFIHFYSNSGTINFGQRPFAYTPPANFLALNTYNI
jgi:hypothetical protein